MTFLAHAAQVDLRRPSRRRADRAPIWLPAPKTPRVAGPETGLSRRELTALRKAQTLIFYSDMPEGGELTGRIVARRPGRDDTDIDVDVKAAATLRAYDQRPPGSVSCYEMLHHVGAAERTWTGAVRGGDELTLLWVRANQTEALDQAAMVRDELHLTATRPDLKRGARTVGTWIVSVRVGPNNLTRMIRYT